MPRPRILLFSFLASRDMADLGNALEAELEGRHGIELLFAGPFPVPGLRAPVSRIPLLVLPFRQVCGGSLEGLPEPLVREVALADMAFHEGGAGTLADHVHGVAAAHHYYRQMLSALRPDLVLVWGASLPHNPLLAWLAQELGAACWDLERGLLPETFLIRPFRWPDASGLMAWPAPVPAAPGAFEAIRRHYLETRPVKYPQAAFESGADLRARLGLGGRTVYALLAHNDVYAGAAPRERYLAPVVAPFFPTVGDTLGFALEAIRDQPEAVLLFKHHPMDRADYGAWAGPRLLPVADAHLHAVCEAADVVLADTTTAQYEALLFDKPLVSLANTHLRGQGVAYEWEPGLDGAALVGQALRREGFDARRAGTRDFLAGAFARELYVTDPELPFGLRPEALAARLADLSRASRAGAPPAAPPPAAP